MTKRQILYHMGGSPLMSCLRRGTRDQLLQFLATVKQQKRQRRWYAYETFLQAAFSGLIGASLALVLARPETELWLAAYSIGLLVGIGYWFWMYGKAIQQAKQMEKILDTLITAALIEKSH